MNVFTADNRAEAICSCDGGSTLQIARHARGLSPNPWRETSSAGQRLKFGGRLPVIRQFALNDDLPLPGWP